MNDALLSSKNMCWCTPPDFFKDGLRQQNITIAFVAVIVLIIALNRFF